MALVSVDNHDEQDKDRHDRSRPRWPAGQEDRRRLQLEGWTYDTELVPWSTSHDQEDEPVRGG
jgi:hypothetical protein